MHGCIVCSSKMGDFRLLFFNHKEVSPFKYEGLIATLTALVKQGRYNKVRTTLMR